jgi:hypothetical protein
MEHLTLLLDRHFALGLLWPVLDSGGFDVSDRPVQSRTQAHGKVANGIV